MHLAPQGGKRPMWVAGGGVPAEARCGRAPAGSGARVGGGPGREDLPSGEPGSLVGSGFPSSLHTGVPSFLVTPHTPVSVPFSSSMNCGSSYLVFLPPFSRNFPLKHLLKGIDSVRTLQTA